MSYSMKHILDWRYIIDNWEFILKNERETIIRSLRAGVPSKYRGKVWSLLTNSKNTRENANFKYDDIKEGDSQSQRIIDCDVARTYPTWIPIVTDDMLNSLRRILNAYAKVDTEIGYTQGMNLIAAMFLQYQDEETAFWSFYSLMNLSSLPHRLFFADNFPKLHLNIKVLDKLVHDKFPQLAKALSERHFDSTLFAPQWLMVCFLNTGFDLKLSAFVFEQYLAYGVAPLISFGMGIIDLHMDVLKKEGFDSMIRALSSPGSSKIMSYREKVNLAWNKYFITTKKYEILLNEVKDKDDEG